MKISNIRSKRSCTFFSRVIVLNQKCEHFVMTQSSVLLDISIFRQPEREREREREGSGEHARPRMSRVAKQRIRGLQWERFYISKRTSAESLWGTSKQRNKINEYWNSRSYTHLNENKSRPIFKIQQRWKRCRVIIGCQPFASLYASFINEHSCSIICYNTPYRFNSTSFSRRKARVAPRTPCKSFRNTSCPMTCVKAVSQKNSVYRW